jgi:hypothetical protein
MDIMTLVLADILAALHLAFVCYVIVAQLLIVMGVALGWSWVRNPWFRVSHLLMIGVVALESIVNFECPLTTWEDMLRRAAGQETGSGQTFIGRLVASIMFFDYDKYYVLLNISYIVFAVLVMATFWLAPPRFGNKNSSRKL